MSELNGKEEYLNFLNKNEIGDILEVDNNAKYKILVTPSGWVYIFDSGPVFVPFNVLKRNKLTNQE